MKVRSKETILSRVLWFENKIRFDIDYFDMLQPRRAVMHHRRYRSGLFHSEKCGRDIQYESALELRFVEQLEKNPRVVFYWDQPVKIPYWRGRRKVNYTPDFGLYLKTGHVVLVEVKELEDMLDYRVQQKTEALIEYCNDRGFGLLLTDGRHTPDHFKKGKVNRKFERALLQALERGPVGKEQCREILKRCNATYAELHKTIIRHNLKFRSYSMRLQRGKENRIFRQIFFEHHSYKDLFEETIPTLFM